MEIYSQRRVDARALQGETLFVYFQNKKEAAEPYLNDLDIIKGTIELREHSLSRLDQKNEINQLHGNCLGLMHREVSLDMNIYQYFCDKI